MYFLISTNATAFLIPFGPVSSPQISEEGFQTVCEPGNKMPQSGQPACQLLGPFLGAGGRRLQDGCARLASIPLWVTINLRNRPALIPKAHFKGFSFIPYSLRRLNVCWR